MILCKDNRNNVHFPTHTPLLFSFTRTSYFLPQSENDLSFQQLCGLHYLPKQTISSWHNSSYFNILFRLSLRCNPNKCTQVYNEERSYQTNGSKVTSTSWWPSESLFSKLPDGVNIPVMLFIEIGTPNIPLFRAKSFYLDNISSLALFCTSPRTGKKGEQFITHESLILTQILTEIQFLLNTYFEYYIHIHMQQHQGTKAKCICHLIWTGIEI